MSIGFKNFELVAKRLLYANLHCKNCKEDFYASISDKQNVILNEKNLPIGFACPNCNIKETIVENA